MRVVAGTARGRRIAAPAGTATRPTTDRVREAVFNALGSLGAVVDADVLDLFAGSGALGIEALSRGASHVHFVDDDHRAVEVITANLDLLGFTDRATVHRAAVTAVLHAREGDGEVPGSTFDLVFADPPYDFADWDGLLAELAPFVDEDGLVVIESDRPLPAPAGWATVREKSYGGTVVTFVGPTEGPG